MFNGIENLIEIDLSSFHTQHVTNMNCMFNKCYKLTNITFGYMDTSKVKEMVSLFRDCKKLTSIDLSKFDTSSLENAQEMFSFCISLISLDLTNFKTTKLKIMYDMFAHCNELLFVNLSSFDTSKVENMRGLFYNCFKLKYLDLQNFSAASVTNFKYIFTNCGKLLFINLRKFKIPDTSKVALADTFKNVPLTTKYCIEDSTTKNFLLNNVDADCSDLCFQENIVVDQNNEKCICNENYKFEYNKKCYENCPQNMFQIKSQKYICANTFPENYYFDINDNIYKECYNICKKCSKSGNNYIHNCDECINNYQFLNEAFMFSKNCYDQNQMNLIQNNSSNYMDKINKELQEKLITDNCATVLDNEKDYIVSTENTTYTITTTKNQKNQIDENVTSIDLGKCEDKLKQKYNISKNASLFILKLDVLIDNHAKVEYEVYYNFSQNNLTKLDLTFCKDIQIDISIPKDIPMNEIDKYNKSSPLYNDICYTLASENGLDKPLKDRQDDYKKNNISICEEGCDFTQYNNKTKKAICSCFTKVSLPLISEIKVDKDKLFENFKDIRNIGNFKMLTCFKLLFDKHNIFRNSANYMIIILFPLSIISIIIFSFYDFKRLKKALKNIFKLKKYINKLKINIRSTNSNIEKKEKKDIYVLNNIVCSKKKIKLKHRKKQNKKEKLLSKIKYFKSYNDYELNELNYEEALKKDKRTFWQLYVSFLKTNHILIFSFCQLKDYNSYIIKIYIFFITLETNYAVSAMFYSDSTMHKIYVEDGLFDFTYQLPQMLNSFIISSILENILNYLGLYEKDIIEFKNDKRIYKKNIIKKILFYIKIKMILFNTIDYILLFFFWIYLGCFCAVYKNTQIHLLIDVSSSFAISIITPFIYIILPCILRIISLKDRNGKKQLLFKISNFLNNF